MCAYIMKVITLVILGGSNVRIFLFREYKRYGIITLSFYIWYDLWHCLLYFMNGTFNALYFIGHYSIMDVYKL